MVFTAFLAKIGLLDVLAPNSSAKRKEQKLAEARKEQAKKDALRLQAEEQRRLAIVEERIQTQYQAEKVARERNQFAKNQRVSYTASGKMYDAIIVGVHLDDDPDKPYYTIKYKRLEDNADVDGLSKTVTPNMIEVEKQTNTERLTSVPWDKEKTLKILR